MHLTITSFLSQIRVLRNRSVIAQNQVVAQLVLFIIAQGHSFIYATAIFSFKMCVYRMYRECVQRLKEMFNNHELTLRMRHALNTPNRIEIGAINTM